MIYACQIQLHSTLALQEFDQYHVAHDLGDQGVILCII